MLLVALDLVIICVSLNNTVSFYLELEQLSVGHSLRMIPS